MNSITQKYVVEFSTPENIDNEETLLAAMEYALDKLKADGYRVDQLKPCAHCKTPIAARLLSGIDTCPPCSEKWAKS